MSCVFVRIARATARPPRLRKPQWDERRCGNDQAGSSPRDRLISTPMLSKLKRYAEELGHCWRLGAGIRDRTRLAIATLSFHLQNARGNLSCRETEVVQHCRIRLLNRGNAPIE